MPTKKLKRLFLISIPIFITHGLEEYFTDFYNIDSFSKFVFGYFKSMSVYQATFLLFQIMIWLLLIISFLLISGNKWQLRLMVIPGLLYVFEFQHIIKALESSSYYSGLITSLLFPIIGFFYWKELINHFKQNK